MKKVTRRLIGSAVVLVLALTALAPIGGPQAEADVSSPTDCSRARGYWTFQWAATGFIWYAHAETNALYLSPDGTEPRRPMVAACVRNGYKPKWIVGFYQDNGAAAGQDSARYHERDAFAYVRRGSFCGLSTSPCDSWRSWHKEKWGAVAANPFVFYNFNA